MNQSPFLSRRSLSAVAGLIGAAVAFSGTPAHAQQSEIDLLRQQLAQLQARLDKLESAQADTKTAVKAAAPTAASSSKLPIVVTGLLQVQPIGYLDQDRSDNRLADTFRLRRGELRIAAPAITPRVGGSIMFDPAKTNNTTNAGSLLQEIVVNYNFRQAAKDNHYFDIGQFKPGFGYESDLVSSSALQTVERALIYNFRDLAAASAPTIDPDGAAGPLPPVASGLPGARPGGGLGDARDQGARIRGTFAQGKLGYNVGIFNGIGERQNGTAGGDQKAIVGRVLYRLANGFQVGASGLTANTRGDVANIALDRDGYGAFLVYKKNKINFQSEYNKLNSARKGVSEFYRNGTGYYASVGYLVKPKIEFVARYDTLNVDARSGAAAATADSRTKEYTLGANYYIKGNNAKIQTNLVKISDDLPDATTAGGLQLRTNFQVAF